MIPIPQYVEKEIRQSPFLREALTEGLINVSALARRIQPAIEKQVGRTVNTSAIIMAINRLPSVETERGTRTLRQFFSRVQDISVRSNLVDYTYFNSGTLLAAQARLLEIILQRPKVFYSFSQGVSETTLLISAELSESLEMIFAGERLQEVERELSAITLMLPMENRSLSGLYYYILRALAWEGINLVEVISTSNEFTVIIANRDLDQAFSVLVGLGG